MKLYISGKISLISAVAALVACIERRQGFDLLKSHLILGYSNLVCSKYYHCFMFYVKSLGHELPYPKKESITVHSQYCLPLYDCMD